MCINSCEKRRNDCQKGCDTHYDRCLVEAKIDARASMPIALREYDREMRDYYYDMDKFNADMDRWRDKEDRLKNDQSHFSSRCKTDKKSYSCKKSKEVDRELSDMFFSKPKNEPSRPTKPTLSEAIEKFQKQCSRSCGCTKSYNRCFSICGGKIKHEKICVENCK